MSHPPTETQQVRRRAAKACSTCHARKVKCDVIQVGIPCTKCTRHEFPCSIEPRKKRTRREYGSKEDQDAAGRPSPPRHAFPEHIMRHQIPHYTFIRSQGPLYQSPDGNEPASSSPLDPRDRLANAQGGDSRLSAEDMSFLKQIGAFNLPEKSILDECVATYFRHFHPFFPVVDRVAFLTEYRQIDLKNIRLNKGPSLLLLQAIIFTASTVSWSSQSN